MLEEILPILKDIKIGDKESYKGNLGKYYPIPFYLEMTYIR